MSTSRANKGFTLIELLVVIAIIGLLSTLAVVALNSARQKTRDAKRVGDIRQIQTALEFYFADQNGYPSHGSGENIVLGSEVTRALCGGATPGWAATCGSGDTRYMGFVPAASSPEDGTCSSSQNDFTYTQVSATSYTISFCIGGAVGELSAGVLSANPNGIQ